MKSLPSLSALKFASDENSGKRRLSRSACVGL